MDRAEMVTLLMGFVLTRIHSRNWPKAKEMAVTRYMRTLVTRGTDIEMSLWLDKCGDQSASPMLAVRALAGVAETVTGSRQVKLHPDLEFKMDRASKGYDQFTARRKVAVK